MPSAIGRSKRQPSLGRSAGDRLTVMRPAGNSKPEFASASKFFAKFRDLTAGGFYTTPVGMKDIGYTGNVALDRFDGPPLEALKKAGLA